MIQLSNYKLLIPETTHSLLTIKLLQERHGDVGVIYEDTKSINTA
jgi:hypothetical protein